MNEIGRIDYDAVKKKGSKIRGEIINCIGDNI